MSTLKVSACGTVTLPLTLRRRFAVREDDILLAEATADGIPLRPSAALPIEIYRDAKLAEFHKNVEVALHEYFAVKLDGDLLLSPIMPSTVSEVCRFLLQALLRT